MRAHRSIPAPVARDSYSARCRFGIVTPGVATDGCGALHIAAAIGSRGWVHLLLAMGAGPNSRRRDGESPLHRAVWRGRAAVSGLLLAAGANPNSTSREGVTALHWAAENAYTAVLGLLLAAGADPNITSRAGDTPLYLAALYGRRFGVLNRLLAAGADPNMRGKEGYTALYWTVLNDYRVEAALLLRHGANVHRKDNAGDTVLDSAPNTDMLALLQAPAPGGALLHPPSLSG